MLDVGRLCIKTAGREAGKVCCIVKKVDENFVIVTGPRELTNVKRRRCNILHLEPLKEKISISAEAQDSEIVGIYQKENILTKLNIKVPIKKVKKPVKPKELEREGKKEVKAKKDEVKKESEDEKKTHKSKEAGKEETTKKKGMKKPEPEVKPEAKKDPKEKTEQKNESEAPKSSAKQ